MMKNFNIFKMSTWVIVIALVTVLFSCNTSMDFAKKRYSSGYYVNLGGKHNGVKQNGTEVSSARKAKAAHVTPAQSLPTETVAPTVASSEIAAPAIADNTITASTDATPVVFANKVDFTSHVNYPTANANQTFVSANTAAKKDASNSSKKSNHKGWYFLGGVAAFFSTLSLHAFATKKRGGGDKSWITAFLLCWLLGGLGVHRFYLGYTWQGIVQLLTGGGCGIWWLIDFYRIWFKDLKPLDGDYS